jgi:threonine aldolase
MGFTSDNIAGASPEVVEAMVASSTGQASPYGADDLTARVKLKLSGIFEREVDAFLVPTGTAANSLCLATITPPWGNIYCHPSSHINNDECGAPRVLHEWREAGRRGRPICEDRSHKSS